MGAWSVSVFANDDAADFSSEFDEANTVMDVALIIDNALNAVLDSADYVEAADGAVGLAAAALVVAWSHPEMLAQDAAYSPQPWPRTSEQLPARLREKAAAVFDAMARDEGNELAELWSDTGQADELTAEITRWRAGLF